MTNPLLAIIEQDAKTIIDCVDLTPLADKSILLTGASGLIGTYILACLYAYIRSSGAAINVTAITHNVPDGIQAELMALLGACVIQTDLGKQCALAGLPKHDFIIHAAGYGQPIKFMANQVTTLQLNTIGTFSLFDHLSTGGRLLFISSSEVYSGLASVSPREDQIGTTNTTHPRACYIEGKRTGEAICNAYRNVGVTASSARLALAYGPGTKPGDHRVLNSFIQRGICEGRIDLQDSGAAMRTYCYIADATEMLLNILLYGTKPVYNVGGNSRTSIAGLARLIGKQLGVEVTIPDQESVLSGAPMDVTLDLTAITAEFQKKIFVTLDEGLSRTIEWQGLLYA